MKNKKDRPWDGRSRIPTKKYKEEFDRIFSKKTKEDIEEENEEYLKELKNKLWKNIWKDLRYGLYITEMK